MVEGMLRRDMWGNDFCLVRGVIAEVVPAGSFLAARLAGEIGQNCLVYDKETIMISVFYLLIFCINMLTIYGWPCLRARARSWRVWRFEQ